MINNPYSNVNWNTHKKVISLNHIHEPSSVPILYEQGVRHLPLSAYYPSTPRYYPLQEKLTNIPSDLMGSPNAEHHSATNITSTFHFLSLGSFFESGLPSGQEPVGLNDTWQNGFDNIFNQLQYEEGGGVVIAHPHWTKFTSKDLCELLDYDDRVLGMEIYSHSPMRHTPPRGLSQYLWDEVLSTGRQAYGFCTIDHIGFDVEGWGLNLGRNVLLVPQETEHDCLKAYRNGEFYGALHGNKIRFTNIQADQNTVSATVDEEAEIKFIVNNEIVQQTQGATATYNVKSTDIYVRVEVYKDDEILYSQPIIYKSKTQIEEEKKEIEEKEKRALYKQKLIRKIIIL